jgi:hypothetical protein
MPFTAEEKKALLALAPSAVVHASQGFSVLYKGIDYTLQAKKIFRCIDAIESDEGPLLEKIKAIVKNCFNIVTDKESVLFSNNIIQNLRNQTIISAVLSGVMLFTAVCLFIFTPPRAGQSRVPATFLVSTGLALLSMLAIGMMYVFEEACYNSQQCYVARDSTAEQISQAQKFLLIDVIVELVIGALNVFAGAAAGIYFSRKFNRNSSREGYIATSTDDSIESTLGNPPRPKCWPCKGRS